MQSFSKVQTMHFRCMQNQISRCWGNFRVQWGAILKQDCWQSQETPEWFGERKVAKMEIDAKFLILMGIQLHYFLQRPVLQLL